MKGRFGTLWAGLAITGTGVAIAAWLLHVPAAQKEPADAPRVRAAETPVPAGAVVSIPPVGVNPAGTAPDAAAAAKTVQKASAVAVRRAPAPPAAPAVVDGTPPAPRAACPAQAAKDMDVACARDFVVALCAASTDPAAMTQALGAYLNTHVLNVKKGLGRLNAIHLATYRDWCEVPEARLDEALRIARSPKKQIDPKRAEFNRENLTWFLSDDGHTIDPAGYARAVEARRAMVEVAPRKPLAEATVDTKQGSGPAAEDALPLTAGLPATPAGWTNVTGYVHPVGRINDLLIDNVGTTTTRTMWAGTDGGGIWKTTNGGTTWTPVNDFNGSLAISNIVRSPRNNTDMYAATNPVGSHTYSAFGILKSTDGGVTWNQLA
ncbi:MAG: hypothetical protein JNK75_00110, partial [Betaproteobacteria bacterium]|nr:hypothetical protein [Betaproteobacteria bacterium]